MIDKLIKNIDTLLENKDTIFIGISGISCAGKTTLANQLKQHYSSSCVIHQDDFFKDLEDIKANHFNCEVQESFHIDEFIQCVHELHTIGSTAYFKYNLASNKRTNEIITAYKTKVNIIEGLHAVDILHQYKLSNSSINVFNVYLDVNKHKTRLRRIVRDTALCNVGSEIVDSVYDTVITQYQPYENQKYYADLILN